MFLTAVVYMTIIVILGFGFLKLLNPFLTETSFKHFYEEYAFPIILVCALSIGITTCTS